MAALAPVYPRAKREKREKREKSRVAIRTIRSSQLLSIDYKPAFAVSFLRERCPLGFLQH